MNNTSLIILSLFSAAISGILTSFVNSKRQAKERAEVASQKAHDQLLLEIKDLQIKLYKLEKDLTEWKEKYFEALQELIEVKSELEGTILKLSHFEVHSERKIDN